jgi:hypothetical protein
VFAPVFLRIVQLPCKGLGFSQSPTYDWLLAISSG